MKMERNKKRTNPIAKFVKKIMAKVVLMRTERFGVRKLRTRSRVMMPRMPQYHMMTWHLKGIFCFLPRLRKNERKKVLQARDTKHMIKVMTMNHRFQFAAERFSGKKRRIPKDTKTMSSDKKSRPL